MLYADGIVYLTIISQDDAFSPCSFPSVNMHHRFGARLRREQGYRDQAKKRKEADSKIYTALLFFFFIPKNQVRFSNRVRGSSNGLWGGLSSPPPSNNQMKKYVPLGRGTRGISSFDCLRGVGWVDFFTIPKKNKIIGHF